MPGPVDIFISYAPSDEGLLRELEEHLAQLKRDGDIRAWYQRLVVAGRDRRAEIDEHLRSARIVLVLMSASYLASDGLHARELAPAAELAHSGAARVIPVMLRAFDVKSIPIADATPLPRNKLPVTSWNNRDEAWADVVSGIREVVEELSGPRPASTPPAERTPEYESLEIRALAGRIEAARVRRRALQEAGASTGQVDGEILELRRRLREGGQLRAGDQLLDGRYLLVKPLGRGGFASVWDALDRKREEHVAIKVLHPDLAREASRRERFFRGARVMGKLGHEAVVRVLSPGGEDGGYHYFVMELAPGGDLRRAVVEGRIPRERVVPLILRVGEALAEAHAKMIVHRDVKPANILLDASGAPRLTDFDLVAAPDTTGGTRKEAMGTFLFAAPEQIESANAVDARADVYGLGMTAIFCLHGADLPQTVVRSPEKVIEILACEAAVKRVLTCAIEVEPEKRFEDARAFCDALKAAIPAQERLPPQHSPEPSPPDPPPPVFPRAPRSALIAVGALIVASGLGARLWWTRASSLDSVDAGPSATTNSPIPPGPPVAPAPSASSPPSATAKPEWCPDGMTLITGPGIILVGGHIYGPGKAFCLDEARVTIAGYRKCVEENPGKPRCTAPGPGARCNWSERASLDDTDVNCVDWNQASAYCSWVGGQLPTRELWARAATYTGQRAVSLGEDPFAVDASTLGPLSKSGDVDGSGGFVDKKWRAPVFMHDAGLPLRAGGLWPIVDISEWEWLADPSEAKSDRVDDRNRPREKDLRVLRKSIPSPSLNDELGSAKQSYRGPNVFFRCSRVVANERR